MKKIIYCIFILGFISPLFCSEANNYNKIDELNRNITYYEHKCGKNFIDKFVAKTKIYRLIGDKVPEILEEFLSFKEQILNTNDVLEYHEEEAIEKAIKKHFKDPEKIIEALRRREIFIDDTPTYQGLEPNSFFSEKWIAIYCKEFCKENDNQSTLFIILNDFFEDMLDHLIETHELIEYLWEKISYYEAPLSFANYWWVEEEKSLKNSLLITLSMIPSLSILKLSNLKLEKIPESIGKLKYLMVLDLSKNNLGERTLKKLKKGSDDEQSENGLRILEHLPRLQELDLSRNNFKLFPLLNLQSGHKLILSNNQIKFIPNEISENVESLIIDHNKIKNIENIENLYGLDLHELDINSNRFHILELPKAIKTLKKQAINLYRLNFSRQRHNIKQKYPHAYEETIAEIINTSSKGTLNLNNEFSLLPSAVLKRMPQNGDPCPFLEVGAGIKGSDNERPTALKERYNRLGIPKILVKNDFTLDAPLQLNIQGAALILNHLSRKVLINLVLLDISNSKIEMLPSYLWRLPFLRVFNISNNPITQDNTGKIKKNCIEELDIEGTEISVLFITQTNKKLFPKLMILNKQQL